jgi:putative membrane protein
VPVRGLRLRLQRFGGFGVHRVGGKAMTYLWIKSLHVISVVAWMAGLFYLPRLFVYHCQVKAGSEASELFKVMERKLLRIIMNPAMVATWVFGIWLVVLIPDYLWEPWFHVKVLFLLILTVQHHMMGRWRSAFAIDANVHSERYYRVMNEAPTLCLIGIVFMVILKPFA